MASLVLVGILVFTQTRGFLLTLLKIFRAWSSIVSSNSVVLWLAHLMGMYFVSSFVLMRMNLSPKHRFVRFFPIVALQQEFIMKQCRRLWV